MKVIHIFKKALNLCKAPCAWGGASPPAGISHIVFLRLRWPVPHSVHREDEPGLNFEKLSSKQMASVSGVGVGGMDTVLRHSPEAP